MPAVQEQHLVTQTIQMLKDHLQEFFDDIGFVRTIPDPTYGYSSDPSVFARDSPDCIQVWCDSVEPAGFYQTKGAHNELNKLGILYVYTSFKQDMGDYKRKIGESIRTCVKTYWPSYYTRALNPVRTRMDYRFSSYGMTGGSRRGLVGSPTERGHNKEAVLCGVDVIRREFVDPFLG